MFVLDGHERLGSEFDAEADVLYLWRGDAPVEAMSVTSNEGHLVRVDIATGEIVGFTIFGRDATFESGSIDVTVPAIGSAQDPAGIVRKHELALVSV
jgi:uncharacterized protein YuzE